MASDPTRAEALRSLIERVEWHAEEGPVEPGRLIADAVGRASIADVDAAVWMGSLDAVARLEAPLRERGWDRHVYDQYGGFRAVMWRRDDEGTASPIGTAPTEARARLLAVLKAMLFEETADAD